MSLPTLLSSIRKLPPTPFRSGGAPQLSDALEAIVGRAYGVKPGNVGAVESRASSLTAAEGEAVRRAEGAVLEIEDGVARREFPVSATLLHPAHDPHYYERMRDGVHRSQQGIGRSWWKRFFQVKGQA